MPVPYSPTTKWVVMCPARTKSQLQARKAVNCLLIENRPARVIHRVLLLPGLLCTDLVYHAMLRDKTMLKEGILLSAANPPGFKGQPVPKGFDLTIESFADTIEELARKEKFDLIVGHSFFANVLVEMILRGSAHKKILISPSLYPRAEPFETRFLHWMAQRQLLRDFAWRVAYLMLNPISAPYLLGERGELISGLVREAKLTPPWINGRLLLSFFDHIERHPEIPDALSAVATPLWYLRGERDSIAFPEHIRANLSSNPRINIIDIRGTGHLAMLGDPLLVNQIILRALKS